jgi:hypothetical protein
VAPVSQPAEEMVSNTIECGFESHPGHHFPIFRGTDQGLWLCGAALDRLGVEWRFARPDVISVAKKESVALLDAFVGPKY